MDSLVILDVILPPALQSQVTVALSMSLTAKNAEMEDLMEMNFVMDLLDAPLPVQWPLVIPAKKSTIQLAFITTVAV